MKVKKDQLIEYIKNKEQISIKDISDYFDISRQAVYKKINPLLKAGIIEKIGIPPKVFYYFKKNSYSHDIVVDMTENINKKDLDFINSNYLIISPAGKIMSGFTGFKYWCQKNNLPIEKTVKEYIGTFNKYQRYKNNGLVGSNYKIKKTAFENKNIDKVFYIDFYSIERFGKTKLGQLLLYAKQSQNKKLIKIISNDIKEKIYNIIEKEKIDAVGFIPPTIKREIQFIKELEKELRINRPTIKITKIKTDVSVPQKTLSKLSDRIENAKETFVIEEKAKYKNILLIDDALGSGATLNEIAGKIKKNNIANKIIGLAIVGSFSGFEVISEV